MAVCSLIHIGCNHQRGVERSLPDAQGMGQLGRIGSVISQGGNQPSVLGMEAGSQLRELEARLDQVVTPKSVSKLIVGL